MEFDQRGGLGRVVDLGIDGVRVPAVGEVALGLDPLDLDVQGQVVVVGDGEPAADGRTRGEGAVELDAEPGAEFVPGSRVVWQVLESDLSYTKHRNEWGATRITFDISKRDRKTEIRFTHVGLVPAYECYNACSDAWGSLVTDSLGQLITTGRDQPNLFATKA